MHFYRFHVGDYLSHTHHLSPMEDLAYRKMLDYAYLHESGLPGDAAAIARLVGLRGQEAEVASVLSDFWFCDDVVWKNKRVEKELAMMADKQAKAVSAGKASANARSAGVQRTFNGRSTDDGQSLNERPTIQDSDTPRHQDAKTPSTDGAARPTSTAQPKKQKPPGVADAQDSEPFQRFWSAFDKKVGIGEAAKAWMRLAPDASLVDTIVTAASNYRADTPDKAFRKHPATWLNQRGWLDERIVPSAPGKPAPGSKLGQPLVEHPRGMPIPFDSPLSPCHCAMCGAARKRKEQQA